MSAVEKLELLFNPRRVAIVGASQDLTSISGKPLRFLKEHGYRGLVYPVNPKYEEIAGFKCYPNLESLPETPDLVLIAVNYKRVLGVLEECASNKVPFVYIFSSGFAEAGAEGRKLQEQIKKFSKDTGIRILGPNCQGVVNLHNKVITAFSGALEIEPLLPGGTGFVTQSGALGYSIFNLAQEAGVGFSYVASTGNEVDLHTLDFLEYMVEDENTKVLVAYLEGVKNGPQFNRIADRALALGKPIIALKVGKTDIGKKAAASHTASLTGSDEVFQAFVKQKGLVRVEDIEDIIDLAGVVEKISLPTGKGLGIVTTSGGAGILLADKAVELGLNVPELPEELQEAIAGYIPEYGSTSNPVDVTAQVINKPEGFSHVLTELLGYSHIDAIVVVVTMITGASGEKIAQDIVSCAKVSDKPIIVAWTAGDKLMGKSLAILHEGGVPCFRSPIRAVNTIGALMNYGTFRKSYLAQQAEHTGSQEVVGTGYESALRSIIPSNGRVLSEHESKRLLAQYGIPITREVVVNSVEDALEAATKIGYPVCLKIDSPDILHKTEVGGIKLNLRSAEEVTRAYTEIMANVAKHRPDAGINGIIVAEMVQGGTEVIIGIKNDPQFGPTVMFGLGGIFVEVLKDVSLRIVPFTSLEAQTMLEEIKGFKILEGARGQKPADTAALKDLLLKVGQMAEDLKGELQELDLNPVLVLPEGQGVKVADALAIRK
jgi:acyl-CoA synthetase (NDP forming)